MHFVSSMKSADVQELLARIREMQLEPVNLMEVCGTHTMAIARSGIRNMLPEHIRLLSGPGCPVCVTPPEMIDAVLRLSERSDVILATYGDMVRVPGSTPGDNLNRRRAQGASVAVIYSPLDALEIARANPEKQVVFLGVGFETTAPGTAVTVKQAAALKVKNFTVLSMLKQVEPALRALISEPDFNVQGFLCPGHVATVIGESGFRFLAEECGIPAVISGFAPEDILLSVYLLLRQIKSSSPVLKNEYRRAVAPEGNPLAKKLIAEVLEPRDDLWRGLGLIPGSGLGIRREYADYDAAVRFDLSVSPSDRVLPCRCGDVIQGKLSPRACPLFGTACIPEDPVGPCMVSSEGACAAAYQYA